MQPADGKRRMRERGQGLVEYALVLILVGIVVILALGAYGERAKNLYCEIVLSVDPSLDPPGCTGIDVSCRVLGTQSKKLNMEAIVTDNKGEDDIAKVLWSVDGNPPIQKEEYYRYCFGGGDASCLWRSMSPGPHTITAVAFDAEGNSGKCSMDVNIPN